MIALFLLALPLIPALKLQKSQIPPTNLDTLYAAHMGLKLPQAPNDAIKAAYKNIILACIPDSDTVYVGVYLDDNQVRIKHIQTSEEGHQEHMDNAGPAVGAMVAASEGVQPLGSDLTAPEKYLTGPTFVKLIASGTMNQPVREYIQLGGKTHRFTAMNHAQTAPLSLVMTDRLIKIPNGLTPEVSQLLENFKSQAKDTPTQAAFDVFYRAQDNTLAFREIYQNSQAVIQFRQKTQTMWQTLTQNMGTLVKQEISGPSSEVEALKSQWKDNEGEARFFTLYDGFQRVQVQ